MNGSPDIVIKEKSLTEKEKKCTVGDLSVDADYDITLRLSDRTGKKTSECAHHFKGSSKHSLMNLIAIGGLVLTGVTAVIVIFHTALGLCCCRK